MLFEKSETFVIAEAGVNHNGSLDMALKMIDIAVEAKVNAIKFQTFKAEKLVSKWSPKAEYQKKTTNVSESQYEMLKKLELGEEDYRVIVDYCKERNLEFLSTPFDIDSLNFLVDEIGMDLIKVSSGDITNAPLLLAAARTGKKIILSTGMCTLGEIETALSVLAFGYVSSPSSSPSMDAFLKVYRTKESQQSLQEKVSLLHCTTEYPTPWDEVNLRVMDNLATAFQLPVGYSDHTVGIAVPIAAVARGAKIIEKHFTLNKSLPGPDHKASLEPQELKAMVDSIRQVEKSLGIPNKYPTESEIKNMSIARKSIVANTDIREGELFTTENLAVKRPGSGLPPVAYWDLIGKQSSREYRKDDLLHE